MNFRISLITICVFSTSFVLGQSFVSGYVIRNNGDTVKGFVSDRVRAYNLKTVDLRTDPKVQGTSYPIEELKWIVLSASDTHLKSIVINIDRKTRDVTNLDTNMTKKIRQERLLLELLLSGKFDLYKYLDEQNELHFFYGTKDSLQELYFVRYYNKIDAIQYFEEFKQQLKNSFADCPKATIPHDYSQGAIVEAFKKYNRCFSSSTHETPTYTKSNKWKLIPHVSGIVMLNKYSFGSQSSAYDQKLKNDKVTKVVPAVVFELTPTGKKIPVLPEIQISYRSIKNIKGDNGVANPINVNRNDYLYDIKFVSVDIGGRLFIMRYLPIRPYVRALLAERFIISQNCSRTITYNGQSTTKPIIMGKTSTGYVAGVGISTDYADIELGFDNAGFRFDDKTNSYLRIKSPYVSLSWRPFRPK